MRSSRSRIPRTSMLITLLLIVLFSCAPKLLAQQKDSEGTNAESNSNSSGSNVRLNLANIQLLSGEYLEMFGAGTTHGRLRGHPSIPGIELGTLSADPLIFSTNSTERMRILSNGFVGIGTTNPITPFELHVPDATPYSVSFASTSRMRLVNSNTTNNNAVELNLSTVDTSGVVSTGVRLVGIFTNHTFGAASADMSMVLRNGGQWWEVARFAGNGNVGFGTSTPAYKLDVAGPIRSTSGGFIFPDGTVQTTAGGGGGGGSQWVTSGSNIYYNAGNVGIGTGTPGVALDVSQNKAIRVGNANLSSGGDLVHLSSHAWFNGSAWQFDGAPGALYQINGQRHVWWAHNGAGVFTPLMSVNAAGNLGLGTVSADTRIQINGGSIRMASVAGELPFQFYSHSNSDSLWLSSGNTAKAEINLSPGYSVNHDRGLALQYIPGTTGAAAGVLNIGQLAKNAGTFTHGITSLFTNGAERLRINAAGNVGIGTTAPGVKLDVAGQVRSTSGGFVFPDGTVQTTASTGSVPGSQWTTSGANIFYTAGNVGIGTSAPTSRIHVSGDGRVTGNLTVDGNIAAKYQDVAEWVPATQKFMAGTVVVLDSTKANQVTSSSTTYDTRVAGVISAQPGIMLGEKSDDKVLVATTGRVRVKVDATRAPIKIGDLLVTSDREGFAMKSLPVKIGGARMHRPGTLIGKALEPLTSGTGEILVLLSLQ